MDNNFDTTWVSVNEKDRPLLDFDVISTQLQAMLKKGKVFIFCPSGQVSGALAIKFAMDTNKVFTKEIATAFAMQRRFELKDMAPWLYQQI